MSGRLNDAAPAGTGLEIRLRGGLEWRVRAHVRDDVLDRILEAPDSAIDGAADVLKRGRSATVVRLTPYVVKRFAQKRPWNRLIDRFRLDRAARNVVLAEVLESLGIATPRVVALARRLRFGLVACAYLVTEELRGARTLLSCLGSEVPSGALEDVGAAVGRLHRAGWSHRDLKATNVMLDSAGGVQFVDLDGIRRRRPDATRRAADLARLFRDLDGVPALAPGWRASVLAGYGRTASVAG